MPVVSGNDNKGKYYKVENVDTKYYVSDHGEEEAKKLAKVQEFAIYGETNEYWYDYEFFEEYNGEYTDEEVSFYYDLITNQDCEYYSQYELNEIDLIPTDAMADNARRGLEVRSSKPQSQRGGTAVGLARARQLINKQNLSPSTVRRMLSYFQRHEVDKQGETWDEQGKGWQAWQFWGGDEGFAWAKRKVAQLDAESEKSSKHKYEESYVINTKNGYIELKDEVETNQARAGRTRIKMVAHEIYPSDSDYNKNGLSWQEPYVSQNIESAIGMPYVVQFLDDTKTIPVGHGTMKHDEDGMVCFPDSESVGSVQNAYIGKVEINGVEKSAMITEGYLYNQRYPNFVKWLKDQTNSGDTIKGSIEINGKGDSKIIEYANGKYDAGGRLRMGRIPSIYDYSGMAILYLEEPSDDTAEMLEINKNMEGEQAMDFKKMYEEQVEKNAKLESDIKAIQKEKSEIQEAVVNANKELEEVKTEKVKVETELNTLKDDKEKVDIELNAFKEAEKKSEVKKYFEEEVSKNGFTEEEMSELNAFVESVDLDGLKAKESELCVKKVKAQAEINAKKKTEEKTEEKIEETEVNNFMFSTDTEESSDKTELDMFNIK